MNEEEIWGGNEGILSVFVSKAKDLPNLIKLDKQNVMLRLRIAHMTRESDIIFRGGQNPRFDYLEKFPITRSVKPIMLVEVYCERKNKSAIPIGKCEVDLLNGMRADPKEGYCVWYELKRDANEFAGTIFIELTFQPTLSKSIMSNTHVKYMNNINKLDASFAARPIPPLPNENIMSQLDLHPSLHNDVYDSPQSVHNISPRMNDKYLSTSSHSAGMNNHGINYMHGSEMRQITPQINNNIDNLNVNNFSSSIVSNNTMITDNTTSTTTTAATKFHFANLKKLKERINIFKNPNSSVNNNETVDIEALEKAIGVTMDAEASESVDEFARSSSSFGRSMSSDYNYNNSTNYLERDSVRKNLPELPTIPRNKSESPRRRPLPPN